MAAMDEGEDLIVPSTPPMDKTVARVGDMGVINRRMIVWGPDGVPRPESVPMLSPKAIEDLSITALSLPYKPDPLAPSDKEFEGMTNAEVMLVRLARTAAGGSLAATETLLDRVLGRPKQSIESKNVNVSYADVLKEKADRAAAEAKGNGTVDCEVVPQPPNDDLGGLV